MFVDFDFIGLAAVLSGGGVRKVPFYERFTGDVGNVGEVYYLVGLLGRCYLRRVPMANR